MPPAARLGDLCTGHDNCPPRQLITASENVCVNGRGAGRVGDQYSSHSCLEHPPHSDYIASGSSTVFINGIPAGRVNDEVAIAGSVMTGSENVFIN